MFVQTHFQRGRYHTNSAASIQANHSSGGPANTSLANRRSNTKTNHDRLKLAKSLSLSLATTTTPTSEGDHSKSLDNSECSASNCEKIAQKSKLQTKPKKEELQVKNVFFGEPNESSPNSFLKFSLESLEDLSLNHNSEPYYKQPLSCACCCCPLDCALPGRPDANSANGFNRHQLDDKSNQKDGRCSGAPDGCCMGQTCEPACAPTPTASANSLPTDRERLQNEVDSPISSRNLSAFRQLLIGQYSTCRSMLDRIFSLTSYRVAIKQQGSGVRRAKSQQSAPSDSPSKFRLISAFCFNFLAYQLETWRLITDNPSSPNLESSQADESSTGHSALDNQLSCTNTQSASQYWPDIDGQSLAGTQMMPSRERALFARMQTMPADYIGLSPTSDRYNQHHRQHQATTNEHYLPLRLNQHHHIHSHAHNRAPNGGQSFIDSLCTNRSQILPQAKRGHIPAADPDREPPTNARRLAYSCASAHNDTCPAGRPIAGHSQVDEGCRQRPSPAPISSCSLPSGTNSASASFDLNQSVDEPHSLPLFGSLARRQQSVPVHSSQAHQPSRCNSSTGCHVIGQSAAEMHRQSKDVILRQQQERQQRSLWANRNAPRATLESFDEETIQMRSRPGRSPINWIQAREKQPCSSHLAECQPVLSMGSDSELYLRRQQCRKLIQSQKIGSLQATQTDQVGRQEPWFANGGRKHIFSTGRRCATTNDSVEDSPPLDLSYPLAACRTSPGGGRNQWQVRQEKSAAGLGLAGGTSGRSVKVAQAETKVKVVDGSGNGASASAKAAKKAASPGKLSLAGAKRRLGFKEKGLNSLSVQRCEEVAPIEARHLVRQVTATSLTDSGNESGSFWMSQSQTPNNSPDPRICFVEGLGFGQIVSRQALVSPYLGDLQLSLSDRRSMLEVEVIRARQLQLKAGAKTLPSPYVKVYLMKNKKCLAKRKTLPAQKTLNPLYQQQFIFREDYTNCVLQIVVWGDYGNKKERKSLMGIVQIYLDDLDISNLVIGWYKLFNVPSMASSLCSSKVLRQTALAQTVNQQAGDGKDGKCR